MQSKTVRLFAVSVLLMATPASAEMSTESVTVTGSRDAYHDFSQTFAAETHVTGKMARWEHHICPIVVGQNAKYTAFITQHIKYVALAAGAPVNTEASCAPNIEIVFTTTPQDLMDRVREKRPVLLGYHDNSSQTAALAKVSYPIQAWYTTATKDLRGKSLLDNALLQGTGDTGQWEWAAAAVTGLRVGDGKSSAFYHVIIVVEPDRMKYYEIGTLADYIAMLALTQMNRLDACQALPSIMNLLASGCDRSASQLTANDLGFLKGLYRMSIGLNRGTQEDEVIFQMQRDQK
jgi:hypothetical protein